MKKFNPILCTLIFLLMTAHADAQFSFGFKFGLNTLDIAAEDLIILNESDREQFKLSLHEADFGFHAGLMTQVILGGFFIQPEVYYSTNAVTFRVEDMNELPGSDDVLKKESYHYLDIPVVLGLKIGPLRLGAGPVGHIYLNSSSDLFDFDGYSQRFSTMTFGWQGGAGLDLWNIHLDFRYEGNFTKFGSHLEWNGREYAFSDNPSRLLFSLGVTF